MASNVDQIVQVLRATLSADLAMRKQAEEYLTQHSYAKGHVVGLMQVAVAPQAELPMRQAASIHFKNLVAKGWEPRREESARLHEEDKATVKENVLEALIQSPDQVRSQLVECMKVMVNADYPEKWPNLLPTLLGYLQTDDVPRVYGAVQVIMLLCRKYEYKDKEEREVLAPVIDQAFPRLLAMLQSLLAMEDRRDDAQLALLVKLIVKTYWSATYLDIPPALARADVFGPWILCMHQIITMPVPEAGQPTEKSERKNFPWWKAKKWSLHIANRMFSRYGNPKMCKPEYKPFAEAFKRDCSCAFLQSYMRLLSVLPAGGYLPDRVVNLALQYLTTALASSNTYKMIKPDMDAIVFQIVFPLLCHNAEDAELWENDPHEYIRKGYDIIEDMYSPRTAAMNFLCELCSKRTKDNMPKVMGFLVQILTRCAETPAAQQPHAELGGALHAIGSLQDKLKSTAGYKEQLEPMLATHVLPAFSSPHGHVRAKAAWCAGVYAEIEFANPQNFMSLFGSVVNALKDPELPVKVDSVVALGSFVEAADDIAQLRPILPQLLDEFFKLMNEVESEDLVFTLETIVEKFGEEIAPYAQGLTANLAAAFWKLCAAEDDKDDDDMGGAMASIGCLRAIATILESVSSLPHLYVTLEPSLMPIMRKMLTQEGYDVYEEVLEIASYMTYFAPAVSPAMWELWPVMVHALETWGIQYFENVLVPMDNYISRGTETFLAHPTCKNDVLKLANLVLMNPEMPDPECFPAPKLMECVLLNCRGRVDDMVPTMLVIALERLKNTKLSYLKDLLVQIVADCLYYNPTLTLDILNKNNRTGEALSTWFQMLSLRTKGGKRKHHRREHDKKVCVLGLLALLSAPTESLPAEVRAAYGQIGATLVSLLVDLKTQIAERKEMEANVDENGWPRGWGDDDDDDFDEELGEDDDEGDDEPLDDATLAKLARQAQRVNPFGGRGHGDDDDDDSDDDGMLTDDENVTSPIDEVDPFISFAEMMTATSAGDPAKFAALNGGLTAEQQGAAQDLMRHADVRREEMAKEKAEEERKKAERAAKLGAGAV